MHIKLGDLVIRKNEVNDVLFQVTGFEGEFAVIKGIKIPIITVCLIENLIKINREREKNVANLRRIK